MFKKQGGQHGGLVFFGWHPPLISFPEGRALHSVHQNSWFLRYCLKAFLFRSSMFSTFRPERSCQIALSASPLPLAFLKGMKPCIAPSTISTLDLVPAFFNASEYSTASSLKGSTSAPMISASGSLERSGQREGDINGERLSLSSLE